MSEFRNRYRIESTRLKGWDYRTPAWYFVTICTLEHRCFLGRIRNGAMHRSQAGEIVASEWVRTESVRPVVRLDEWVVMPNHVHGIIEMGTDGTPRSPAEGRSRLVSGSLGAIIGQFKTVCTKRIRKAVRSDFGWQDRFHDHIIRDEEALQMIRWYIRTNPSKWPNDRMYRV